MTHTNTTTTTAPLNAQSLGHITFLVATTKQRTPPVRCLEVSIHKPPQFPMCSILSAQLQLSSAIHFVTYSSDGTLLADINENMTKLWRVADGVCLATLAGHSGLVNSVSFSPDGTLLATGSANGTTKLWRVADGACTATLAFHSAAVSSVVFSPDSTLLASVGSDGMWLVWDMKSDVPLCSGIVPAMEVEDVGFIKCDSQCCVLEYRCVGSPLKRSVKFEWNAPSNDGVAQAVAPNGSVPLCPHVCLTAIAVGTDIARDSLSVLRNCSWRGRSYVLKLYYSNVIRHIAPEVAIAPYLQHPNIVRVVAIVDASYTDARTVGLLMELVEDSLAAVLASPSRPSIAKLLRWLHEAAQGIAFAHECGVVHSNIKLDTIMTVVSEEQHVVAKVTDFGPVGIVSTFGPSMSIAHRTPMFVAPEYAVGGTGRTKASDVFSFGMTMWYALVPQGTDLGLGTNGVEVVLALQKGCRPSVTAIDPSYATLIERCWAAEPLARPSMGEVAETLRKLVACLVQPPPTPSSQLWATLLKSYNIEAEWKALQYRTEGRLFFSDDIVDTSNRCYQLVAGMAGSLSRNVRRVVMVGTNARTTNTFVVCHEAEVSSCLVNGVTKPIDAASVAGLDRLKQSFISVVTAPGKPLSAARLLFGWHGTSPDKVTAGCRDGPSSLRITDSGFFGSGLYFALEAEYALRYSPQDPATGERAMTLVEPKVITPESDYRRVEDLSTPHLHGFSQYYSGNPTTRVPLAHGYDSHFIPVKNYECTHPLTGLATSRDVGYQAVDESSGARDCNWKLLSVFSNSSCVRQSIGCFLGFVQLRWEPINGCDSCVG